MRPFPGFLQSLGLICVGVAAAFLTALLAGGLAAPPTAFVLLSSLLGSAAALSLGLLFAKRPLVETLRLGGHPRRGWGAIPLLVAGAVVLVSELDNVVQAAFPPPAYFSEMMQQILAPERPADRLAALALAGCLAPLAEELLFRGLILRGLAARHGERAGVLITSVLFAVYHLNPWQGGAALALGILLGWMTCRSGRIGYAVALHAGNNLAAITLGSLAPGVPGIDPTAPGTAHVPPPLVAAGAALLAWGLRRFASTFPATAPGSPPAGLTPPGGAGSPPPFLDSSPAGSELSSG